MNKDVQKVDGKLELTVQVLICTDYSVYLLHQSIVESSLTLPLSSLAGQRLKDDEIYYINNARRRRRRRRRNANQEAVINHMKDYYTEVMDQVNERYQNSFTDDPYLNINIELAGFYIAMVSA